MPTKISLQSIETITSLKNRGLAGIDLHLKLQDRSALCPGNHPATRIDPRLCLVSLFDPLELPQHFANASGSLAICTLYNSALQGLGYTYSRGEH